MPSDEQLLMHGTAVALGRSAALIRGPSGAGKSDLALRFLLAAASGDDRRPPRLLVSDDQVVLRRVGPSIVVSAPAAIRGLLEVRGIGIVEMASIASAELQLVVDCCPPETIERMPEPATVALLGIGVRQVRLAPFEPSAAYKLLMLLENDRLLRNRPSMA